MNVAKDLEALLFPVADLNELPGNPRRGDVEAVKRSYEAFGQRKPLVARRDENGQAVVVAGNHQLKAVRELGWDRVAVVWADDLSEDEARGFALADNRVGDLGTYDTRLLAAALDDLVERNEDLAEAAGWSREAVDAIAVDTSLPDDFASFAPVFPTADQYKEKYDDAGVVSIAFPIAASEHDALLRRLFAIRKHYQLDTNTEAFVRLIDDAFEALPNDEA